MQKKYAIAIAAIAASGLAIACEMLPMPYLGSVKVTDQDIAIAGAQGYNNPARAAALKKLDQAGEAKVGASAWKANNYLGAVMYQYDSGGVAVTEDKPCNEKAADSQPRTNGSTGSGSSGSYTYYGGRVWSGGTTCVWGCGTVTVGPPVKEA